MSRVVVLTLGEDEIEAGTIEEVVALLGPASRLATKSPTAFRIAGFVASVVESVSVSPDGDTAEIKLEIR